MKKIILMLMVALFATTASAQLKFGVRGGATVTQLNLNVENGAFSKGNRAGFFIGPAVKLHTPLGLGFDASLLYTQSEFRTDPDGASEQVWGYELTVENPVVKQQFISVPVNLRYSFGLGDNTNLFIFAGPQFNFNVGKKTLTYIADIADWKNNSAQIGVNIGVGVTLLKHLQVNVNYNIACTKTSQLETSKDIGTVKSGYEVASAKTNFWQVGLGWWF